MLLETRSFEFGEFTLDAREKVLSRGGKPLSVTPKAINLLLILLENHGHLVERNDLMRAVWADSFVEEANITFTVGLLRKAFEDDAQNPRFIETVPRRGYRFIHQVEKIAAEAENKPPPVGQTIEKHKPTTAFIFAALLFITIIALGGWLIRKNQTASKIAILNTPFASEKLSTNGKVFQAAISPDGKNVIYASGMRGDRQSVWIRQLDTGANIEIIPPSDNNYVGFAVSPDANFLYFSRIPKNGENQADIYRTTIFGGVPQKIISETQGWISVSPDGAKVSFVRCYYLADENCSLWVADSADGKNEKKIASRPAPFRIGGNKFSPDGKRIAFAAGQSQNQANEFSLMEADIETGAERELTTEKFFNIKNLEWLPGENSLLLTASRIPNKNFYIWQVSADTGKAEPLTKDSENYAALSLSKNGDRLVSTRVREEFRLRLLDVRNSSANRVLADASNAAFSPNGKIYFTSVMSGSEEIWVINPDGSGQRQLTNNSADDSRPVISPDGNSIFFASNRTGAAHVWRMNTDGGDQKQITRTDGGFPIFVSPDNKWIYYQHGINRTLRRVSLESGDEQIVLDKEKFRFAVSPDGTQVAFSEKQGEEKFIVVVSIADGQTIKTYKYPDSNLRMLELVWMPDEKALAYILTDGEFKNNALWRQTTDGKSPEKINALGDDEISEAGGLAVSPDGNSFLISQGGWRHDAVLLSGVK